MAKAGLVWLFAVILNHAGVLERLSRALAVLLERFVESGVIHTIDAGGTAVMGNTGLGSSSLCSTVQFKVPDTST